MVRRRRARIPRRLCRPESGHAAHDSQTSLLRRLSYPSEEETTHNPLVQGSNPCGPTNSRRKPTLPASPKAQPLRTAAGSCGSARGPRFPPSRAQKPEKCSLPRPHSLSPWSQESQEPSDEVIHTIKINHLRLVQEYELDGRRGWQSGVKLWRCLGLNARQVVTPRSKTAASHPW